MKLSQYAKKNSITYRTAFTHFSKGLIKGAYQLPTGTIVIPEETVSSNLEENTVVYTRVSSSENKDNLESQAKRVSDFCAVKGWVVNQVVKECASGLNDKRPKLESIITDETVTRIVVEHKDRLTRFGFNYIKKLFKGEIVVINEVEEDEKDLMQDFVSLVTSFCARIYGKRRSARRAEKLIKDLKDVK